MGNVGKSSLQLTGLDCVLCVKLLSRSIFSIISVIPPGHCMWGLLCRVNAHQRGVKNGNVQNTVISSVRMVWFAFKSFAVWGWPPPQTPSHFLFPWSVLFCSLEDWSPLFGCLNTLCLGKTSRYSSSCGCRDLWGQGRSWHLDVSIFFPTFHEKWGINSNIFATQ